MYFLDQDCYLCPVEELTWHNTNYLKGNYNQCGIDMLMTSLVEEDNISTRLMQWKCYELVIHAKMRARKDKVLILQYKETTLICFLDYLRPKLKKFIVHNYVAYFKEMQYIICLDLNMYKILTLLIQRIHYFNFIYKQSFKFIKKMKCICFESSHM